MERDGTRHNRMGQEGAFGTWDGTGRNGTRRSVPRLVHQKWVERAVPRDRFWVFLRSTSPLERTNIPHVFFKNYTFVPSRPVPSRPVPSRPVPFRPVCVPNAPGRNGTGRNR
ncbi:hypothetical protein ACFX19_017399 [Malus domestica]